MEKATTDEKLRNLRVHLAIANRNERDFDPIIRSQVEAEISDILAGKETQQEERDRKRPDIEVRVVLNDEWLAEAKRRLAREF
jgi:hypothetical protein